MASAEEKCREIEKHLKLLLLRDQNQSANTHIWEKQEKKAHSSSSSLRNPPLSEHEFPLLGNDTNQPPNMSKNQHQKRSEKYPRPSQSQVQGHGRPRNANSFQEYDNPRSENCLFDSNSTAKGRQRERRYSEGEHQPPGYSRRGEPGGKNHDRTRHSSSVYMNGEIREESVFENAAWKKIFDNKAQSQKKPVVELSTQTNSVPRESKLTPSAGCHFAYDDQISKNQMKKDSSRSLKKVDTLISSAKSAGVREMEAATSDVAKSSRTPDVRSVGEKSKGKGKHSSSQEEENAIKPKKKGRKRLKRGKKGNSQQEFGSSSDNNASFCDVSLSDNINRQQKRNVKQQIRYGNKDREKDRELNSFERGAHNRGRISGKLAEEDSFDNPKFINKLKEENIDFAKRVTKDGVHVVFVCQMCDFIGFREKLVKDHLSHKVHKNKKLLYLDGMPLHKIPPPCAAQVDVLSDMMEQIAATQMVSAAEMEDYEKVIKQLNTVLQEEFPECHLRLFGSLAYGVALKGSGVDLNLEVADGVNPADVFVRLDEVLKAHDGFCEVSTDFFAKIPSLECVDMATGIRCHIIWNNTAACNTSALIADYCIVDPRVKTLAIVFRYWAKICGIDDQKRDMIPSYCFMLMLIHFLQQQLPPVLPILYGFPKLNTSGMAPGNTSGMAPGNGPEVTEKYVTPQNAILNWKVTNHKKLGELWLELLQYYSIKFRYSELVVTIRQLGPLKQNDRKWNARGLAIEDPFMIKRNIARCVSTSTFRFIRETFKIAYKYFAVPQLSSGPLFTSLHPKKSVNPAEYVLTKYFSDERTQERRKVDNISREMKDEYLDLSLLDDNEDQGSERSTHDGDDESSSSVIDGADLEDHDPDVSLAILMKTMKGMDLSDPPEEDKKLKSGKEEPNPEVSAESNDSEDEEEEEADDTDQEINSGTTASVTGVDYANLKDAVVKSLSMGSISALNELVASMRDLKKEDIHYQFSEDVFVNGRVAPLYCRLCQRGGHLKQECPYDKLPELEVLSPPDDRYLSILDDLCVNLMWQYIPGVQEFEERNALLLELQSYIRDLYKEAKLELFGSSCNGFGFTQSDLDICLTFSSEETGKDLNHTVIIEALADRLRQHKGLYGVIPITTAKVPIVKFVHRESGLDGDISLYNTLAKHNTRMLNMYCKIDERVKILGFVMKYFAKVCDICDASRGSLSSYAYVLMVLYFLQQRNPPVIPVLQELYDKTQPKPEVLVDGWNAWFYDDLEKLESVWPEYGKNNESVGELWLGLLRFYTEVFDFKRCTICIRQKAPLCRLTKMWTSSDIAIEDPFNLNHNLGAGVSRKMSRYILSAFVYGRNLFANPPKWLPQNYNDLKMALFDPRFLTDGAPPNDRGCHLCGKIGHKLKDCPKKTSSRRGKRNQEQMGRFQEQGGKNKGSRKKDDDKNTGNRKEDVARNHQGNQMSSGRNDESVQGKQQTRRARQGSAPQRQAGQQQQLNHQPQFAQRSSSGSSVHAAFPVVSAHQSSLTSSMIGSEAHNSGMPCQVSPPAVMHQPPFSQQKQMTKLAANQQGMTKLAANQQGMTKLAANLRNNEQGSGPTPGSASAPLEASRPQLGASWSPTTRDPQKQQHSQVLASPQPNLSALLPRPPVHPFTHLLSPSIPPFTCAPNIRPCGEASSQRLQHQPHHNVPLLATPKTIANSQPSHLQAPYASSANQLYLQQMRFPSSQFVSSAPGGFLSHQVPAGNLQGPGKIPQTSTSSSSVPRMPPAPSLGTNPMYMHGKAGNNNVNAILANMNVPLRTLETPPQGAPPQASHNALQPTELPAHQHPVPSHPRFLPHSGAQTKNARSQENIMMHQPMGHHLKNRPS